VTDFFATLTVQRGGFRPIELLIGGLVGVIGASYLVELFVAPPDWSAVMFHTVVPRLDDSDAILLAVGIIGATVMPHTIYVHSGFTQDRIVARTDRERRRLLRFSNREVMLALGLAGPVKMRWSRWLLRSSTTACMTMWRRSTQLTAP
jgi:manganese transport protein